MRLPHKPTLDFVLVRVCIWLATNALIAIGFLTVQFAMLGNLNLEQVMAEAENLAGHYRTAGPQARAAFGQILIWSFAISLFVTCLVRRSELTSIMVEYPALRPQAKAMGGEE